MPHGPPCGGPVRGKFGLLCAGAGGTRAARCGFCLARPGRRQPRARSGRAVAELATIKLPHSHGMPRHPVTWPHGGPGGMMVEVAIRARRRARGAAFQKGRSGNPAGRPPGSRNKATLAAEMLLDGEAAALTRQAVARALAGSDLALKLCLDRILAPRRERTVRFALPAIASAADLAAVLAAIATAVADGAVTPGEASELSQVAAVFIRAIETSDFERRLQLLEACDAARP
jgi:Family of unknown function (DUF5681)